LCYGSTDKSYEKIRPYLDLPNIKYIEQENQGVAAARNKGINNSSGKFVAFLDQDDLWLPTKIERQVTLFENNPEIALVHSKFSFINGKGDRIEPLWLIRKAAGYCSVIAKRKCIEEAGMFDENIAVTDDYDLWLRITYYHPIGYVDEPLAMYRYHGQNTSMNMLNYRKNELKVVQKILKQFPKTYEIVGEKNVRHRLYYPMIELSNLAKRNGNISDYRKYSQMAFQILPLNYLLTLPRRYIGYYFFKLKKLLKKNIEYKSPENFQC
jgi:glycosyltransferase involved in cell wall biosynthesis